MKNKSQRLGSHAEDLNPLTPWRVGAVQTFQSNDMVIKKIASYLDSFQP